MDNQLVKEPRIQILCQLFFPELISTGLVLTELSEALSELSLKVSVVCGQPTIIDRKTRIPKRIEHKGIMINRVWSTKFSKLHFLGKLTNQLTFTLNSLLYLLFQRSNTPIMVLTEPPFLGMVCALMQILKKKPYIYVVFDVYPDTAINLGVLKKTSLLARLWEKINHTVLLRATAVVVIGRCMQDVMLLKGHDIPSFCQKLFLIPNWSNPHTIRPVERQLNPFIKNWSLENKFTIAYQGNMGRFHDMETIMQVACNLAHNRDICFLFVGEGYRKQWMQEFVENHNLGNCRFHTYVPREELPLALASAHVGLVSLLDNQEGLSVPSKTYGIMACAVPVIAVVSKKSEIAQMLTEENCGIVVEPEDTTALTEAILKLYSDEGLRKRMGERGRKAVEDKYSLKHAAQKYLELIKSLEV
jgi:glycosyltransferase involved in cell wall biosynthesis